MTPDSKVSVVEARELELFKSWLRTACFQAPPDAACDLAWSAWKHVAARASQQPSAQTSSDTQHPYLTEQVTRLMYNPNYGDDRTCKCGHRYHRHFDSYDRMANIGCKYCECTHFEEQAGGEP